jgi:cell division transport system ATP-binding protein
MSDGNDNSLIIRMFHVYKRHGSKNALTDVTFDVYKNEFLFLIGPSGAGKTTLLKLLYFGESVSEGHILIDGMNLSRISSDRVPFLRRKFGIIFQDYKLIPTKTVFENVALVLEVSGRKKRYIEMKVKNVLRTVGMEDKIDSLPPTLSGGEQQRVAVARAVVGAPKIILADEPTGSLDTESADIIFNLLRRFHSLGTTVILATHNQELIRKNIGRRLHLTKGCLEI